VIRRTFAPMGAGWREDRYNFGRASDHEDHWRRTFRLRGLPYGEMEISLYLGEDFSCCTYGGLDRPAHMGGLWDRRRGFTRQPAPTHPCLVIFSQRASWTGVECLSVGNIVAVRVAADL
jgi:hypothetical protein